MPVENFIAGDEVRLDRSAPMFSREMRPVQPALLSLRVWVGPTHRRD